MLCWAACYVRLYVRLCYVTVGWILDYVKLAYDIGYVRLYVKLCYVTGGWMLG